MENKKFFWTGLIAFLMLAGFSAGVPPGFIERNQTGSITIVPNGSSSYIVLNGSVSHISQSDFLGLINATDDVLISGNTRIHGELAIKDTSGVWENLSHALYTHHIELENLLLNPVDYSKTVAGGVFTFQVDESDGNNLQVNINRTEYHLGSSTDTVTLTCGSDLTPETNFIHFLKDGMYSSTSSDPEESAVVARGVIGGCSGTDANVYGFITGTGDPSEFIKKTQFNDFYRGAIILDGFTPDATSDGEFNTTSGNMWLISQTLNAPYLNRTNSNLFYVNASGSFVEINSLDEISYYSTGESIASGDEFSVVIRVVPNMADDEYRYVAVVQRGTQTYTTCNTAEQDKYNMRTSLTPNDFINRISVPVMRVVVHKNGNGFCDFGGSVYWDKNYGDSVGGTTGGTTVVDYTNGTGLFLDDLEFSVNEAYINTTIDNRATGGSSEEVYDCVVDSTGNGDSTTIDGCVNGNYKSILVKGNNGTSTYNIEHTIMLDEAYQRFVCLGDPLIQNLNYTAYAINMSAAMPNYVRNCRINTNGGGVTMRFGGSLYDMRITRNTSSTTENLPLIHIPNGAWYVTLSNIMLDGGNSTNAADYCIYADTNALTVHGGIARDCNVGYYCGGNQHSVSGLALESFLDTGFEWDGCEDSSFMGVRTEGAFAGVNQTGTSRGNIINCAFCGGGNDYINNTANIFINSNGLHTGVYRTLEDMYFFTNDQATPSLVLLSSKTNITGGLHVEGGATIDSDLTVASTIDSSSSINLKPNNQGSIYTKVQTVSSVPYVTAIGNNLRLSPSGYTNSYFQLQGSEAASGEYLQGRIQAKDGANFRMQQYGEYSGYENVTFIAAYGPGGRIEFYHHDGVVGFSPNNDRDDYAYFHTSGDIPRIGVSGGTTLYFIDTSGTWLDLHAKTFTTHTANVSKIYRDKDDMKLLKNDLRKLSRGGHPKNLEANRQDKAVYGGEGDGVDLGAVSQANAKFITYLVEELCKKDDSYGFCGEPTKPTTTTIRQLKSK